MGTQDAYRKSLNCPMCGCVNTTWSRNRNKMVCNKCGYEFERPPFELG